MKSFLLGLRNDRFWHVRRKQVGALRPDSVALDLGSGPEPQNPFRASAAIGVDVVNFGKQGIITCDLAQEVLPLPDCYASIVTAFDFLEHIPRYSITTEGKSRLPLVELFNEIHRVLEPGGHFFSYTPVFPRHDAFVDPTHVNIMTKRTVRDYFCGSAMARIYGFKGHFDVVWEGWKGSHWVSLLRKPRKAPLS